MNCFQVLRQPLRFIKQFQKNNININHKPRYYQHQLQENQLVQQQQFIHNIKLEIMNQSQALVSESQRSELMFKKVKKPKDRFGIYKIKDIGKLLELSRNRRLDLSLNDYITVYLRITELTDCPSTNKIPGLDELIQSIQKEIQKSEEEDPSIGSLSISMARSQYYEDKELWISICDYVLSNKYDDDFDEVYNALKGFTQFQYFVTEKWQLDLVQDVLNKIISNTMIHIQMRRYSLKTLRMICELLVLNQRKDPSFYQEIEHLVLVHLHSIKNNLQQFLLEQENREQSTFYYQDVEKIHIEQQSLIEDLASIGFQFATVEYSSDEIYQFLNLFIQEGINIKGKFDELREKRRQEIIKALKEKQNRMAHQQQQQQQLQKKNQLHSKRLQSAKQSPYGTNNKEDKQEDPLSFLKAENKIYTKQQFNQKINEFGSTDSPQYGQKNQFNSDQQSNCQQNNNDSSNDQINIPNELIWPLTITGTGSANLLNFFNYVLSRSSTISLEPIVQKWLTDHIYNQETDFTLLDLNNIHKGIHLLSISDIGEFRKFLESKLFQIDFSQYRSMNNKGQDNKQQTSINGSVNIFATQDIVKLDQIHNYLEVRARDEFDCDFSKLNKRIFQFLDDMCHSQMPHFSPYSVYYFTMMVQDEMIFPNFLHFLAGLPDYVNKNITSYSFDEMCFFCLVCNVNAHLLTGIDTINYYGNLNLLKEHIRQASLCRGFKIDMNSNFHKLLQVIDMAEFFNGGEMM